VKKSRKRTRLLKMKLQVNVDIRRKKGVNPLLRNCWLGESSQKQMPHMRKTREKQSVGRKQTKDKKNLPRNCAAKNVAKGLSAECELSLK
jgi:hypothetical protein